MHLHSGTLLDGASARATIRLDGIVPTAVSNLYMVPLPVSADVQIKARAFHPDWTSSDVLSASYTIDTEAPTITASRFPAAIDGWHNTATTVSFTCQDDIGIASCSSSMTIAGEGAGQQIVGTAIDQAGRQATETVSVNLDATCPDRHPHRAGRNDVVLAARDAAGNVASKGIRITRVGTATTLGLTPTAKTLVLDEHTTLTLSQSLAICS